MDKKKEDTSLSDKLLDEPYKLSDLHGSSKSFVMKKLMCVLLVCLTFMAVEVVGGILASSIAILSDAAHLLSDVLGFVISMISVYISGLPASTRHSYGFHRAGVIGALASVVLIWGLTGFLIYFATVRIIEIDSIEIDGEIMFGTATFGLLANLVMIKVLHGHGHGHSHDHGHDHGHSHGHSHGKHDHSGSPYITHVRKSQIKPITSNVVNNLHDQGHEERSHSQSHSHDEEEQGHSPDLEKRAHSDDHSQEEHKHDNEQEFSPQSGLMVEDVEHENHVDTVIIKEEDIRCPCDDFSPTRSHTEDRGTKENGERNNFEIAKRSSAMHVQSRKKVTKNKSHTHTDLNLRAAAIHVLGDIIQSIGVMIASGIIWFDPNLKLADPICTYIFSVIVMFTTIKVAKDCIFVLMEAAPEGVNMAKFEDELSKVPGVIDVHDLHVWSLSAGKLAMSAHLLTTKETQCILKKATKISRAFNIYHTTIQVENIADDKHFHFVDCKHDIH